MAYGRGFASLFNPFDVANIKGPWSTDFRCRTWNAQGENFEGLKSFYCVDNTILISNVEQYDLDLEKLTAKNKLMCHYAVFNCSLMAFLCVIRCKVAIVYLLVYESSYSFWCIKDY